jgi:hypothetical protein
MKQHANNAAIYCRLSRDDGGDSESNSIINQRDVLRRYAIEQGFLFMMNMLTMESRELLLRDHHSNVWLRILKQEK